MLFSPKEQGSFLIEFALFIAAILLCMAVVIVLAIALEAIFGATG